MIIEEYEILMEFINKNKTPNFDTVTKTFSLTIEELCDILFDGEDKIVRFDMFNNRSVRYNSYLEKVILSFYTNEKNLTSWRIEVKEVGGNNHIHESIN